MKDSETSPLNVAIVTSQVTYVPQNYEGLLSELFKSSSAHIKGLVFLKNLDLSVAKSILGLRYLGASRVQMALLKNVIKLPLRKREKLAKRYGVPIRYFKSMNDQNAISWCKHQKIDLIVNARTRCIYKNEILSCPQLGCLNVHHGILPKYRGTMCDLNALAESRPAGFTIHEMNEKIDDGKIIEAVEVSDGKDRDYLKYLENCAKVEGQILSNLINQIASQGKLPEGTSNSREGMVFTRNPNRQQIFEMKQKGMLL